MRRIHGIMALGVLAAVALTSCDNVDEADRFVPTEIEPQRAILIEEYTGQRCTNCPDGHKAIQDLTASLGDSIVPVGIHASDLADNPPLGLKTETGEAYFKASGSPALPTAVINMQTDPLQVAAWGAAIDKLIMTPTPFTIVADAKVNGSNLDIKVDFSSGDDYTGKMMVWICENDIVRMQIDHGVTINNYVHNHVFRAAVTDDIWGQPVEMKAHQAQTLTYSYPIDRFWVSENLYVVAFLYNDGGVAQVTSSHQNH